MTTEREVMHVLGVECGLINIVIVAQGTRGAAEKRQFFEI